MASQQESSQPAIAEPKVGDASVPKRKGLRPSSKKRIEKFRLRKSKDTLAEIRRCQATERTSISLDALLQELHDMRIVAQKQEVVPVTTRGVGFLVNESMHETELQCPKAVHECSVHETYRVAQSQLQLQLDQSDVSCALSDLVVEQLNIQNPRLTPEMTQQIASCPLNFSLVNELVNSVGRFETAQTNYRPEVVGHVEVPADVPVDEPSIPKRRRTVPYVILPDPYSVTFRNLRATVVALADPATPAASRAAFIRANPIPGARFVGDLLVNPDEIIQRVNFIAD